MIGQDMDDLERFVYKVLDGECGIVRYIALTDIQPDEPELYVGIAEMVDATKIEPLRINIEAWEKKAIDDSYGDPARLSAPSGTIHSSGAGLDRKSALWATVGEACERYSMNYCHPDDLIYGKPKDFDQEKLFLDKLILFSDEQYASDGFPYAKCPQDVERAWLKGYSLSDGSEKLVPAELCVGMVPFDKHLPIDATYSTGCAAGPNYNRAIQSGLAEAVERDAFIYYWLTASKPQKLDLVELRPFLNKKLSKLIDFANVSINLRWLKTDIDLPVVACFTTADNARGLASGAACHPDWRVAIEKAIVESFHTLNWTVDLDREMWRSGMQASEIRDFPDHVRYYLNEENHSSAECLISPDAEDGTQEFLSKFGQRVDNVPDMIALLKQRGFDPIVVDRTYDDLESLDMFVVHVIVPGLHPLHVGVGLEHQDRYRLEKIADFLGNKCPERLNLKPHPFP